MDRSALHDCPTSATQRKLTDACWLEAAGVLERLRATEFCTADWHKGLSKNVCLRATSFYHIAELDLRRVSHDLVTRGLVRLG